MFQQLDITLFDVIEYDGRYLALQVSLFLNIELLGSLLRRGLFLSRGFIVAIFPIRIFAVFFLFSFGSIRTFRHLVSQIFSHKFLFLLFGHDWRTGSQSIFGVDDYATGLVNLDIDFLLEHLRLFLFRISNGLLVMVLLLNVALHVDDVFDFAEHHLLLLLLRIFSHIRHICRRVFSCQSLSGLIRRAHGPHGR